MKTSTLRLCAALFLVASAAPFAQAQVITDAYIDRGLTYRGPRSFEGEPWTQRYSYGTGAFIFLNGDSRQLRYLDYLDRADRAQKFGYKMPVDPYFPEVPVEGEVVEGPVAAPPAPAPARMHIGSGLGWFRRR